MKQTIIIYICIFSAIALGNLYLSSLRKKEKITKIKGIENIVLKFNDVRTKLVLNRSESVSDLIKLLPIEEKMRQAGGKISLKFYASVRMDIRKVENIKQDGEVKGNRVRVKVIKNKVAPPFREAEFDVVYGEGISKEGNILDMAVNLDIIEKSGSWFSYDGERIGQGRENVKRYLKENPSILEAVEKKVRDNFAKAFEQSLGEEIQDDDEIDE